MKKIFYCKSCHNVINCLNDSKAKVMCCDEEMQELIPNTVEASAEKHIPSIEILGNKMNVVVGTEIHPMSLDHGIRWILVNRKNGSSIRYLTMSDQPIATFYYNNDVISVYAYCNIHGLWEYKMI